MNKIKLERYMEIAELEKKLKAEKAKLREEIISEAGDREVISMPNEGFEVKILTSPRTTLDTKTLKIEKPDVYTLYSVTSNVTKLTVKKI